MTFFKRIFGQRVDNSALVPLYNAIVTDARQPHWYVDGAVPDTLDGRFDMVSGVLALALLRLEAAGDPGREPAARLTEIFITDMDGQLRQSGIGDLVVGKHIGRMMSQLGGRLSAYRDGLGEGGDLAGPLDRNLYRGAEVPAEARAHVERAFRDRVARLAARDVQAVLAGDLG